MPLYDFVCGSCGKSLEVLQSFNDNPPTCCGNAMTRQMGKISLWLWAQPLDTPYAPHPNPKPLINAATNGYREVHGI